MFRFLRSLVSLSCILLAIALASPDASAQILSAKITGGLVEGETKDNVASFKGIPFAAPPVGPLRWKSPQPVKPWEGVRKTTAFGPSPVQNAFVAGFLGVPLNFSEDCLYLNVWTPATNTAQKLPVMVWIYGGAFKMGSTATPVYDGARLAQKGVIIVSVGYRVGVFGFLAHPELSREGEKGNFGLRDQLAGLEWVRNNIAAFGGDPKQVTIFGESAGGMSVSLLVSSPKAKGLFQRAISESGAAFFPTKKSTDDVGVVSSLALAEQEGVAFLSELGAKDISAARALSANKIESANFSPAICYDGDLLVTAPPALYEQRKFNDTPILVGFNSDDGAMFVMGGKKPDQFVSDVRKMCGDYADKVLALYPHDDDHAAFRAAKDAVRDSFFGWPAWYWARLHARYSSNPAFVYYYDYHNPKSDGANHAAELGYVFQNLKSPQPADTKMSDVISTYWVNFAKTGNPNTPSLQKWEPFTAASQNVMVLDSAPRMSPVPNLERLKVFDSYFESRRKTPNPAP